MASSLTKLVPFTFLLCSIAIATNNDLLYSKPEKLTQFRLYLQDKYAGTNRTVVPVAGGPMTNQSATHFGLVTVFDDALTVGPWMSSETVGRAQGLLAFASQTELAPLMVINFVFTGGKYRGSSLSLVGRNLLLSKVRELSIVGGTGYFRLARGYAVTSTFFSDPKNGLLVPVYDLYVYHY